VTFPLTLQLAGTYSACRKIDQSRPKKGRMKIKSLLLSLQAIVLAAAFGFGCATPKPKITRVEAEKVALARVPNGTIKDGELEKEHGGYIWSFDIAVPGTKDITEVHVDAKTGDVVSVEKETPADEAKEKKK